MLEFFSKTHGLKLEFFTKTHGLKELEQEFAVNTLAPAVLSLHTWEELWGPAGWANPWHSLPILTQNVMKM